MVNGLRHNENKIHNRISENILSKELRSLNSDKLENTLNNNYEISKKDSTKKEYRKINDKNNIYLNIYNKCSSNYKTKRKNNAQNFYGIKIIKYFIIIILLCRFCTINSLIDLKNYKIYDGIIFYSYEITLKLKGTGTKNILGADPSYNYSCPSYIYLNNESLTRELEDCHYIDIKETDVEIKLEWNNIIINSTRRMFYNCIEITEIDMTKFDTSLVTDMSEMFALCSSLESLNVSNLNTERVETFENMFYQCTSLASLNLESFTNPSATSLSGMFYGCTKLEHINIKNFEEIENTNLDDMFYNIPQNAVICLSSCPPPTNFTISDMDSKEATISWEGNEFNDFIISYDLQNLENPENGKKINVTGKEYYKFTNLNSNKRYDVYIKTDCGSKSSYWIGPLLISIESINIKSNTNSITTCSKNIYNSNSLKSDLIIKPEGSGKLVSIKGNINILGTYYFNNFNNDYFCIDNGEIKSKKTNYCYYRSQNISLFSSETILLSINLNKYYSWIVNGYISSTFQLTIGCIVNSQTIYNLIKGNNCRMISCDNDYRSKQNIIDSYTGKCKKNCISTDYKYQYRGICYINCPSNTKNIDFICYSNSVIEKCEEYSIESDNLNLCIKCKENYYPKLNDNNNKENFFDCYKNNSLENYYLDNDDLLFKPCFETCKTCNQNGTIENHNCIICDSNFKLQLSVGDYYNCYPECNNYYYFDKDKNYKCLDKKECPNDYKYLIEQKKQCIDECYNDPAHQYNFGKKCFEKCPEEISYKSETKNFFCEAKCTKEKPLEKIEYQECTDFCSINEMYNRLCISKFNDTDNPNSNGNLILKNIIQDITHNNFDTNIFSDNKNIIINESFISFIITNNKIQKNAENIIIDLGNCENILKDNYDTEELVILLIEIDKKDSDIKKLGYEVYSKKGRNILQKLDLNLCKDVLVNEKKLLDNNAIITCSKYSIDSILEDSCIACAQSYYPKYEDNLPNKPFIKCYQQIDGYFLYNNEYFKKCYESCDTCEEEGDIFHHNCITCNSNYFYELNISSYLNCYNICDFYFYYDDNIQKYYCTPYNNCVNYYDKIISEKNQCVHDCKQYKDFQYEFKNKCYNKCPEEISEVSKEKEYFCELKCSKDLPYELIETQTCVKTCTLTEINDKKCKKNYISENKNEENEAQEKMVDNIKEEITNGLDTSGIDKGEDIIIQQKDITVTITKSDNQKNQLNIKTNTTNIDLVKCEKKLKEHYNISENESLYILKMDVKQEGYKIPKIQYEVYYPLNHSSKLCLLDLSVCEDVNIDVHLPLTLEGSLNQYDPKSDFYNDICNTFTSEYGTDITLSERKKNYINNNLAVCEENCNFVQYNDTLGKAICSCKTKTEFVNKISENALNKENLLKNFADFKNIFNIKILKCFGLIFSINSLKENYANIILMAIIIFYFICLSMFVFKNYKKEIIFHIDIIVYFTLFPVKILYLVQRKEKEMKRKVDLMKLNNDNNINIYNVKNMKKNFPVLSVNSNKDLIKVNEVSNPIIKKKIKKKIKVKKMKKIVISEKIKKEEKTNEKFIENGYNFHNSINLSEDEIYALYKKLYTKTDNELNELSYKDALKYDKRTFCAYYLSLVKSNHLICFSFLQKFDFNSRIIKMYLFFFNFATLFFVNALFFTDEAMGKINIDEGYFNISYNLPQIIYSSIISSIIIEIIKIFALTEISFILFRNELNKDKIVISSKKLKKIFKIKFIIFFVLDFILLVCFWIYLSCFSAVYHNTQIYLIEDTLISFATSLITPFALYLIPGIFRILALKNEYRRILYEIYRIIQFLI